MLHLDVSTSPMEARDREEKELLQVQVYLFVFVESPTYM
jgi:hypothetical protein